MTSCRPYQPSDRLAWDNFVQEHPHGSPFHLIAWQDILTAAFGYRPEYLLAVDDGNIAGVLPLFLVDNFVTGKVLLSSPFAVYGGILATTPESHAALREHAVQLAQRLEVQYLELRNAYPEQQAGFHPIDRYVTFTQEVSPVAPDALLQAIPKKTRNLIRKAQKYPYSTRITTDLTAFYSLIVRSYRRLGTPVFPLSFFAAITKNFGKMVDVREVLLEGKVVAASMNFLFAGQMHT
jgi:FemAB-related protein (PEP-CTERM system-associated)